MQKCSRGSEMEVWWTPRVTWYQATLWGLVAAWEFPSLLEAKYIMPNILCLTMRIEGIWRQYLQCDSVSFIILNLKVNNTFYIQINKWLIYSKFIKLRKYNIKFNYSCGGREKGRAEEGEGEGEGRGGKGNGYNMMENCFLVIIDSAIYFM